MNSDAKVLALGALLHDIGKFRMRTEEKPTEKITANGARNGWNLLKTEDFLEVFLHWRYGIIVQNTKKRSEIRI